jgi:predicted NBD/HSP70 family sugar kinase
LEALASAPAILREIQEALAAGEPSTLVDAVPMTLDAVTRAADVGDELAQRILATAGRWLGVGLTSLVNILNPQLLIINDEAVGGGRWYFEPMETALRTHAFDGLADSLRVMIEPGGNEIWARGAACVVLSALFTATVQQHDAVPLRVMRVSARS